MRLQEIRERLEKLYHNSGIKRWEAKMEFEEHAEADVDYLIERIERYEAALKDIMHKGKFIDTVEECCFIAEEALKEDINPIG